MMTDQSQSQAYVPHPQEDSVQTPPQQTYAEAYVPPQQPQQATQTAQPAPQVATTPPAQPAPISELPVTSETPAHNQAKAPLFPGYTKPPQEETVLEWDALSRPFKQRSRQFFSTLVIIVILVSLILFFAGQFIPIAVVVALAFLAYILSVIPPTLVRHRITTFGLRVEDNLYYWDELGRFWFTEKYGQPLLHLEVDRFPGRLTLLLGQRSTEEMRDIFSEILLEQQPEPTFFDKAATWIEHKIPLESPSEVKN